MGNSNRQRTLVLQDGALVALSAVYAVLLRRVGQDNWGG